ncbi:MAG: sigma-54-dependent Fis family transcriptional regulator [Candidatus Firestonebacteria bacterium]|nr:sigma-54-dependent Fis family transcriptional regulator [Candidatus Firestonebacteria bacterium]
MFIKEALIVDDEPLMQRSLHESFKRHGFQVHLACNGQEAIEIFRKNPMQLVISDIKMPCMDGIDLLRSIKSISPSTYVVLMTAYGNVEKAVEALKIGAYDFIEKPFSKEKIDTLVKNILAQHSIVDEKKVIEEFNKDQRIITSDNKMLHLMETARAVAKTKATILIQGESGTGKEIFANFIHENSARNKAPFIAINCAALPENLLESELFGHEKGAFTGAINKRKGIFERADGGTLFLDEIGEISKSLQAKLLRVIQERRFERVGGETSISVDIRIITSTNRNLAQEVKNKNFREDLFYRLNVVNIELPPLRERKDDINILTNHFIQKFSELHNLNIDGIGSEIIEYLKKYSWPGNIRELQNVIERAVIIKEKGKLELIDFSLNIEEKNNNILRENYSICDTDNLEVHDLQKEHIVETLKKFNGNRTHAAKALGISVRTIRNHIRDYRFLGMNV